jgi:hypothetical protein
MRQFVLNEPLGDYTAPRLQELRYLTGMLPCFQFKQTTFYRKNTVAVLLPQDFIALM